MTDREEQQAIDPELAEISAALEELLGEPVGRLRPFHESDDDSDV